METTHFVSRGSGLDGSAQNCLAADSIFALPSIFALRAKLRRIPNGDYLCSKHEVFEETAGLFPHSLDTFVDGESTPHHSRTQKN